MYYGTLKASSKSEPRPLRVPFLLWARAYCSAPASVTWLANNNVPHVRRATAVAVSSTLVLGSWSPAPNYTSSGDHVYHHVHFFGVLLSCQLGVRVERKSVESREKARCTRQ
ncbi:hypothetical protein L210DRAFT_3553089, partial [Boletus edulis BED1]